MITTPPPPPPPLPVLVICARRYNGHELWTLLGVLNKRGHPFEVVSSATLIKDELTFRPNIIARTLYDVVPTECEKFAGICVVSGNMADTEEYWRNTHVLNLIRTFRDQNKLTAAICCSVPTLAPICPGIKVSFFPLIRSRKRLLDYGAIPQPTSLTVDGKIVTAENQMITEMWAEEISNVLEGLPSQYVFTDSGFVPKGRERRMPKAVRTAIDEARQSREALVKSDGRP